MTAPQLGTPKQPPAATGDNRSDRQGVVKAQGGIKRRYPPESTRKGGVIPKVTLRMSAHNDQLGGDCEKAIKTDRHLQQATWETCEEIDLDVYIINGSWKTNIGRQRTTNSGEDRLLNQG
jgi:hypothetical protein